MHKLYQQLEQMSVLAERARIIREYLKSNDIGSFIPQGSTLLDSQGIPFVKRLTGEREFLNFVVGKKYNIDEPDDYIFRPAYVLAGVQTKTGVELLVVDEEEEIFCLPSSRLISPTEMLKETGRTSIA